jgi:hypothetical protein
LDIMIAPLMPCQFNDSKSNIKTLEFAVIGVPGVYGAAKPYDNMSLKTDNDDKFISYIEELAESLDKRKEIYDADFNTIKDQVYWEGIKNDGKNVALFINTYLNFFNKTLQL